MVYFLEFAVRWWRCWTRFIERQSWMRFPPRRLLSVSAPPTCLRWKHVEMQLSGCHFQYTSVPISCFGQNFLSNISPISVSVQRAVSEPVVKPTRTLVLWTRHCLLCPYQCEALYKCFNTAMFFPISVCLRYPIPCRGLLFIVDPMRWMHKSNNSLTS